MADNLTTDISLTTKSFVYGLEDYGFMLIHVTALVVLVISLITSVGVVVYLLYGKKLIFYRPIGERLVVYLAICDLLFNISHIMDHSYMIAILDNPPDAACAVFAFFLNEFVVAQALVVTFTAINAFIMVVKERKIELGKYDWKLMLYALGIPAVIGIVAEATGHFGPTGMWCYIDQRKPLGPILANILAIIMVATFSLNLLCYGCVWIKIRQVAHKTAGQTGSKKYHRTARVMMLFVAAYILQWWGYVVLAVWEFVAEPHVVIRFASVSFSNMGGVFNFIAYTFVRKRYQNVQDSPPVTKNIKPIDKASLVRETGSTSTTS